MVSHHSTIARTARTLCALTALFFALLLAVNSAASGAASVADLERQLADDKVELADLRDELQQVVGDIRATNKQRATMKSEVEDRMVSIYMAGGNGTRIFEMAADQNLEQFATYLFALDTVARHDRDVLDRWAKLGVKLKKLRAQHGKLKSQVTAAKKSIKETAADLAAAREERARAIAEARRAAAEARARAAERARERQSSLIAPVVRPEEVDMVVAEAQDAAAGDSTQFSSAAAPQAPGYVERGVASMYADSFTGQTTANGETYDPTAYTAAHPSLPFGTYVNVRSANGTVVVRINDRGPFVGGRVIDLSRAAAQSIGMSGLADVTLTVG